MADYRVKQARQEIETYIKTKIQYDEAVEKIQRLEKAQPLSIEDAVALREAKNVKRDNHSWLQNQIKEMLHYIPRDVFVVVGEHKIRITLPRNNYFEVEIESL